MPQKLPSFKTLTFGFSAAEKEAASYPELLLDGFLDLNGATDRLLTDDHFLVLGYKGSGKSAIAEHLALKAKTDHHLFVRNIRLEELPFAEMQKMAGPSSSTDPGASLLWTWILACNLLDSFRNDDSAPTLQDDTVLGDTVSELERIGILPSPGVPQLVHLTTSKAWTLQIPNLGQAGAEAARTMRLRDDFPIIVDHLKQVIFRFESYNNHLLVIDGLDDLLVDIPTQRVILGGLVSAATRLNEGLAKSAGAAAKVVLLCRTDLFQALPGSNTTKVSEDSSVNIMWYENPRAPLSTSLVNLADRKARVGAPSLPAGGFLKYLPEKVGQKPALRYILDHTRHTPRDFLRAFHYIQQVGPDKGPLSAADVKAGLRLYSISYFINEVRNELSGFVGQETAERGLETLASLHVSRFTLTELIKKSGVTSDDAKVELRRFAKHLFEVSAIGSVEQRSTGKTYFSFKYRNREATFNTQKTAYVHPGLWDALDIPPPERQKTSAPRKQKASAPQNTPRQQSQDSAAPKAKKTTPSKKQKEPSPQRQSPSGAGRPSRREK